MARSETHDVLEAEKGKNLSPRSLHLRLRVVEIVTLLSLLLNLALWYFAGHVNNKVEDVAYNAGQTTPK